MPTTAAFIVNIITPDLTRLPQIAEDIQDACEQVGLNVESVAPWSRPSMGLSMEDQFLSGGLTMPPPGFVGGSSPNLGA